MSPISMLLPLWTLLVLVTSLPACWLPGHVVLKTHNLLRPDRQGSQFTVQCLPFNSNMSFPKVDLSGPSVQCDLVYSLVHRSLEGAEAMFRNATPGNGTWNPKSLDEFRLCQQRLIEAGRCLPEVFPSGALDSYFLSVTRNLQQPGGARCAWWALRRDLHNVLNSALRHQSGCFNL